MKKILVMLIAVVLVFALFGCAGVTTPADTTQSTTEVQQETVFDQFEKELVKANINYEKVTMAADLVGAAQGVKYKIDNGAVELYLFDEASDAYKSAEAKQAISLDGFGDMRAKVDNGMALLVSDLDAKTYEDIFESIVK